MTIRQHSVQHPVFSIIACFLLLGFISICQVGYAQMTNTTHATFGIKATPEEVDEGDVVDFELINLSYVDSASGARREVAAHPSKVEWNFGEGVIDGGLGLNKISHRFVNGDDTEKTIKVDHQHVTKQIKVKVRNVKPSIYRMWHSKPVFRGQLIKFHALAKDPGLIDSLTYTWNFDDGGTATGQHVEHRFSKNDDYEVRLKVDDKIAFDTKKMTVVVDSANSFTVSGDISQPNVDIDQLILAASTKDPMAKKTSGACQIRVQMGNEALGTSVVLTASLQPGFDVRKYRIGKTTKWDGSYEDDAQAQGTFFADVGFDRSIAIRDFGGAMVGGPFWSESGQVTIHKFDGKQLELSFQATLLEHIPGTFHPR
jgi:hypothetical protein